MRAKLPRRSAYKFPAPRGLAHFFRQSRGNVIHTPFIIALLAYFVNGKRQKMIVIFYTNLDVSYKILCFEEKRKTRCIIWRDFEPTRKRACGEAVRTSPSQKNKRLSESKNQPVILSGERSSQSNFCGLSVCEQAEARGIFAEAGYGLKSRWLTNGMLHQFKSHPNSEPYPCGALAPWFYLAPRSVKLRLRKPLRDFLRSG